MSLWMSLAGALTLWGIGLVTTSRIRFCHLATRFGVAYGIGIVWVVLAIGLTGLLRLPIRGAVPAVFFLVVLVGVFHLRRGGTGLRRVLLLKRIQTEVMAKVRELGLIGMIGLLMAFVLLALTAGRIWLRPITGWDAWNNYSLKAKLIYLSGTFPATLWESVDTPNYPLGPVLQQVWAALMAGSWNETAIQVTAWGYFASLGLLAYGFLRQDYAPSSALFGTLFVCGLPLVIQHAGEPYTDLPLAYFVLGQAVALTQYLAGKWRGGLLVAAWFGVGAVLTRVDGSVFVVWNVALLSYLKVSLRERLVYLGPAVFVWSAWTAVKWALGIEVNLSRDALTGGELAFRFTQVMAEFGKALFMGGNWFMLWPIFFVAFLMRFRATFSRKHLFMTWPVVFYLVTIIGLFMTTDLYQFLQRHSVLHRLILHVAPLAALWVVYVFRVGENSINEAKRAKDAEMKLGNDLFLTART